MFSSNHLPSPFRVSSRSTHRAISGPGRCFRTGASGLATKPHAQNRPLYLIGPDDCVLFTIAAASESGAASAWQSAMRTAFPDQE